MKIQGKFSDIFPTFSEEYNLDELRRLIERHFNGLVEDQGNIYQQYDWLIANKKAIEKQIAQGNLNGDVNLLFQLEVIEGLIKQKEPEYINAEATRLKLEAQSQGNIYQQYDWLMANKKTTEKQIAQGDTNPALAMQLKALDKIIKEKEPEYIKAEIQRLSKETETLKKTVPEQIAYLEEKRLSILNDIKKYPELADSLLPAINEVIHKKMAEHDENIKREVDFYLDKVNGKSLKEQLEILEKDRAKLVEGMKKDLSLSFNLDCIDQAIRIVKAEEIPEIPTDENHINIPGIGIVPINFENTSSAVLRKFTDLMKEMQEIFEKKVITQEDYEKLQKIMQDLKSLALEGDGKGSYLTLDMISRLNIVFTMLDAVGITPDGVKNGINPLNALATLQNTQIDQDGKKFSFLQILKAATSGIENADKSFQSLLNSFLKVGNDVYNEKLTSLKEQLELSLKIIETLKDIQTMANNLKSITTPDGKVVPIVAGPVDANSLIELRGQLLDQIKELEKAGVKADDPNSLIASLQKVADDIANEFKTFGVNLRDTNDPPTIPPYDDLNSSKYDLSFSKKLAAEHWTVSNAPQGAAGSSTQNNITKAAGAAQALNDQQKEEVHITQYDYDQFVKISSLLLQMITKIIEKFAQQAAGH